MKVFDGFTFYNELDLLRVRLVEHSPFVDFFVLVEGDHTFSGSPKDSCFDPSDPRFIEFRHKIIHVKAPLDAAPCNPWENERRQRDAILSAIQPSPDDLVLISDLDEIVSRHHWQRVIEIVQACSALAIRTTTTYYYVNLLIPCDWTSMKIYKYDALCRQGLSADAARRRNPIVTRPRVCEIPATYGWHFSYIGTEEFIRTKIRSFSHQEYNTSEWNRADLVQAAMRERRDLFGRYVKRFAALKVDDTWPIEMLRNPLWRSFTCDPDPLPFRLRATIGRQLGFCKNAMVARMASNKKRED